jgi:hypothetical protein
LENNSLELIGNYIFLAENQTSIDDKFGFVLGKLLIWCLLHGGAWPSWLHSMHLHYIYDENINYIEIFKELNPHIYDYIKKLESGDNSYIKDVIDFAKHYNENVSYFIINFFAYYYKVFKYLIHIFREFFELIEGIL